MSRALETSRAGQEMRNNWQDLPGKFSGAGVFEKQRGSKIIKQTGLKRLDKFTMTSAVECDQVNLESPRSAKSICHHAMLRWALRLAVMLALIFVGRSIMAAPHWTLIGWNNLGMHCMDDDYAIFSILPPYNTVDAQLIDNKAGW